MVILHIYRTPPDDTVRSLRPPDWPTDRITEVSLDDEPVDYARLLELILESDKVYTWF